MDVAWTIPALDDLDEIQDYIAQDSPITAHRFIVDLMDRTNAVLGAQPMAGRPGRLPETREWIVPRAAYIVAYRVNKCIEVLAVINAAKQWPDDLTH
ncbi:type II toxin-antitoxin system RelE/ParE family toxin [Asticcacaulis solisilvae]|uniref:type II toxin-antitoxin system RelE/ParE family toxin n=1 Tax=Asticcacaulis solisilvae TaxID=1217274 RepID=UPI003FD78EF2